jgi:hypothetical protein
VNIYADDNKNKPEIGDALQLLRALAAYFFPRSPAMTRDEKVEELLDPSLRKDAIADATQEEREGLEFARYTSAAELADEVKTSRTINKRKKAKTTHRRRF